MSKETKPTGIRFLNSLCAVVLIAGVVYIAVAGFQIVVLGAVALALIGAATPVVVAGDGFLEVLMGIFGAFMEGIMAIVEGVMVILEAIASALSGLFG